MTSMTSTNTLTLPAEARIALHRKYGLLLELRRANDSGEPRPKNALFKQLAAEFPGALRELDRLPAKELGRRLAELSNAERSEPWMLCVYAFHSLFRCAFFLRKLSAQQPSTSAELLERTARHLKLEASLLSSTFVEKVLSPPNGRLTSSVEERIGELLAISPREVGMLVFGAASRHH